MIAGPYLAILSARVQLVLQYRAAALAGFVTQCWWGGLKVMVYVAFFAGSGAAAPMSLSHTLSYTWLGQAFLVLLPWYADPDVAEMVRSGALAYERLRPVDTQAWWFCRALAWNLARVAPRAVMMFLLAGITLPLLGLGRWGLAPPPTLEAGLLFFASISATALLSSALVVLLNVIVAATLTERGPNALAAPIANLLSGSIVPLAFFPAPLAAVARLLPFAGLMDTPFRIWNGTLAGVPALAAIGLQIFWTLAILLLGRVSLEAVMTRVRIQGG